MEVLPSDQLLVREVSLHGAETPVQFQGQLWGTADTSAQYLDFYKLKRKIALNDGKMACNNDFLASLSA